jgi:hypothetical protein
VFDQCPSSGEPAPVWARIAAAPTEEIPVIEVTSSVSCSSSSTATIRLGVRAAGVGVGPVPGSQRDPFQCAAPVAVTNLTLAEPVRHMRKRLCRRVAHVRPIAIKQDHAPFPLLVDRVPPEPSHAGRHHPLEAVSRGRSHRPIQLPKSW